MILIVIKAMTALVHQNDYKVKNYDYSSYWLLLGTICHTYNIGCLSHNDISSNANKRSIFAHRNFWVEKFDETYVVTHSRKSQLDSVA